MKEQIKESDFKGTIHLDRDDNKAIEDAFNEWLNKAEKNKDIDTIDEVESLVRKPN